MALQEQIIRNTKGVTQMDNDIILQTRHLKKCFGKIKAVNGVNLKITRGQVYGFLGPNGSGKTTTIGLILGLLHPTAGIVTLFGEPVSPFQTLSLQRVGALISTPAVIPYLSARMNLALLARLSPEISDNRIDQVLDQVGLLDSANRRAGHFSTGMKQRLGLAIALLHQPELLILDEPTNGMDPAGMHAIRVLLRQLADQGMTIFLSSHLLHEIEQICDRVAVLNRGEVVAENEVKHLLGDKRVVRVRTTTTEQTTQCLRDLPGIREVCANGAYVEVSGVPSQTIIAHLTLHGIIPIEVSAASPDLESIFLELTRTKTAEV